MKFAIAWIFASLLLGTASAQDIDSLGFFFPYDISADGSVVVGAFPAAEAQGQAAYWTDSLGLMAIPDPMPGEESAATAVSADGRTIVGHAGQDDSGNCYPGGLFYDGSKSLRPFVFDGVAVSLLDVDPPTFALSACLNAECPRSKCFRMTVHA